MRLLLKSGQRSFLSNLRIRFVIACLLMPGLTFFSVPIRANPSGGVVVHGDVSFGVTGNKLQINQNSPNAIINWNNFSIDAGELTKFVQPGVNSAVLNRVVGGNVSEIHGALQANGNVFVINPNGILVGAGGTIDVHGLVLSTLDVSNGEFLAGGDQLFKGRNPGNVTNMGRINAIGGDVFLIGKTVTNSGSVTASNGTVGFAAGEEVLLTAGEDLNGERLFVRAKGAGVSGTGIFNDGTIEGAAVELKAHGNAYALAINNKGSVRATGASSSGGRVFLNGVGGSVQSSGSIRASAPGGAGSSASVLLKAAYARVDGEIRAAGGNVVVEAGEIEIGSSARVDVSGVNGGGSINVGGGFQGNDPGIANARNTTVAGGAEFSADALSSGDGGRVVIWADEITQFEGSASARALGNTGRGGFVEISGKENLQFDGLVDASAVSGQSGTVLFDPGTVHVGNTAPGGGASLITIASINSTLDTNSNVTIFTDSGDIIFDNVGSADIRDVAVQWNTDASLGVFASGDVTFNTVVRTAGAGSINVIGGWNGAETDPLIIANNPEAAWNAFVAAGQFGIDDGDAATGDGSVTLDASGRSVEVGSRYGNTNVAGLDVNLLAGNGGRRHAQMGFRDNGQVFYYNTTAYNGLADPGDPLIAMVGVNETTSGSETGVYMFDSNGVRTDAFLRYSDDFGSQNDGNWWWRTLDGTANGSSGVGDNLPGMGAGISQSLIDGGANHSLLLSKADITIEARGALTLQAGSTGDYEGAYAQIGHGGNARGWNNVNRRDTGRDYSLNFGGASRFSASIGRLADVYGDINIRTGLDAGLNPILMAGTVLVNGGVGGPGRLNNNYAQIGHMGLSQFGSATGEISVEAGGAIGVNGGNGWRSHAQIGHAVSGGHTESDPRMGVGSLADTGQTPDGKFGGGQHHQLRVFSDDTDFNNTSLRTGDLAGTSIVTTTTGANYTGAANLYSGSTSVTGVGTDIDTDLTGNIEVISETGEVVVTSYEARTPGGVPFDPDTQDYEETDYAYGQIGHAGMSNGMQRVSSNGDITVTGTELLFRGGNNADEYGYVQLGHGGALSDGAHVGNIFATATTGKIEFLGGVDTVLATTGDRPGATGDGLPNGSYAQLGHGGYDADGSHSGNITVVAGSNAGIGVNFVAGNTSGAYVQMGHGGYASRSTLSGTVPQGFVGDITVTSAGSIHFAGGAALDDGTSGADHNLSAHLGHGGYDSDAVNSNTNFFSDPNWGHSGEISVSSTGGDITFTGGGYGTGADNTGRFHWTQLGHGGYASGGNHHGDITVSALAGGVTLTGGGLSVDDAVVNYSYAQIGHGASEDQGNVGLVGDTITVSAGVGGVNLLGGAGSHNFAKIGNGGYNSDGVQNGTIIVNGGAGGVTATGGADGFTFVQIGNGGYGSDGDYSGAITVNANAGGIDFNGGPGAFAFAMIGNGGAEATGDHSGAITVASVGDITFDGGSGDSGNAAYAQIGHGGYNADGNHLGAISVRATGASSKIEFNAGTGSATEQYSGSYKYAMIGHGGVFSSGDLEGQIDVESGSGGIHFVASDLSYFAHAMIGHGGRDSSGGKAGNINVTAAGGGISFSGGGAAPWSRYTHAQIGHGGYGNGVVGDFSGNILVTSNGGGRIDFTSGDEYGSYTMLGHGGFGAASGIDGSMTGNIEAVADGSVNFQAGTQSYTFSQLGHGGRDVDGVKGGAGATIDVTSHNGSITFAGGLGSAGERSFSQLGHGGADSAGDTEAAITVSALNGGLTFSGGTRSVNYSQLGNGGVSAMGTHKGVIIAAIGTGGIDFDGGSGSNSHAQIGHGGYDADGDREGAITVSTGGGINFQAGAGGSSYAQIGHGGNLAPGASTGDIQVTANGATGITFAASSGGQTHAQIGHGGYVSAGIQSGSIEVTASGASDIIFTGGTGYFSGAQIGHGGREVAGDHNGAISVDAGTGAIDFTAGSVNHYTSVQIGHGSPFRAHGNHSGNINVSGGTVNFDAGTGGRDQVFAIIGHGGYDSNGNHSGTIDVTAMTGDITLTAGTGIRNFAQIGHGGEESGGSMSNDICVHAGGKVTLDSTASTAIRAYTQIGHGGFNADGNHSGSITVTSGHVGTGGVTLLGGNPSDSYAQIGHGGSAVTGNMEGSIRVIAGTGGSISLTGGTASSGYAMIGHGDGEGATSAGTREGGVQLFAGGTLTATSGIASGNVNVYHQTSSVGGLASNYLGGDGFQIIGNGGVTLPDSAVDDINAMIDGNFGNGPVSLAISNDVDITIGAGKDYSVDTAADFFLLTGGDITMLSSYQNSGTGGVTLVAGWSGNNFTQSGSVTYSGTAPDFNYCEPTISAGGALDVDFNCPDYANNGGTLVIGSAGQTAAVAVGSAEGSNVFAGAGVNLFASASTAGAYTQLGYHVDGTETDPVDGAIDVFAKDGNVTLTSGSVDGSYTQIGHGAPNVTGVTISAPVTISFCDTNSDVILSSGDALGSYSQIGHGGMGLSGTLSGAVSIDGAGDVTISGGGDQSYSQIGHGGSSGTYGIDNSGDPTFTTPRFVSATGTVDVINTSGAISMTGGAGLENAYAQIGHGGVAINGAGPVGGTVTVDAGVGGLQMQGGDGSTAYALIGSGGYQITSAIDGAVVVNANGTGALDGIVMNGGDGPHTYATDRSGYSGAMIGNGGYLLTSTVGGSTDVTVESGGLMMTAGNGYFGNVTIGHAALGSGAAYDGSITVEVKEGDVKVEAGAQEWFSFAQIGHGGWDRHDHSGAVSVTATEGDISVLGGEGLLYDWAKIGHGGYGNGAVQDNSGAITVVATAGDILLESRGARYGFTQIGHGGLGKGGFFSGEFHDDVTVTAGNLVSVVAGSGEDAFAQIGHGGNNVSGIMDGTVRVTAGAGGLLMNGGTGSHASVQVGHGGLNETGVAKTYTVNSASDVIVNAGKVAITAGSGAIAYGLLGHGGYEIDGDIGGNISVTTTGTAATDGISLIGGGNSGYAMIGKGGRGGDIDITENVSVTSAGGGISLAGGGSYGFALIGSGGYGINGALGGNTTVTSNGGTATDGISLAGGTGNYGYANIGNASNNATGSILNSNTTVNIAGGGLTLQGGTGILTRAAIGLQSRAYQGDRSGSVEVNVDSGNVVMTGGNGIASQAHIGHGGYGASGVGFMEGDVSLTVLDGTLSMNGGDSGYSSYAMVGNGGANTHTGALSGNVTVDVSGTIIMESGDGVRAFTQIGNGGEAHTGDFGKAGELVSVFSRSGGLMMTAGNGNNAYTMIGSGGSKSSASNILGSVTAQSSGSIMMSGGDGVDAFAQIGLGGQGITGNSGAATDEINVISQTGGVSLSSGNGTTAYAMIGMGGDVSVGDKQGDINVTTVSGVTLNSLNGVGVGGFTKIGHGGHASDASSLTGTMSGDITVSGSAATSAVTLSGGDGSYHYSQIGHGGYSASGTKTGFIDIDAGSGGVSIKGGGQSGENTHSFAQVGHGGTETSNGHADGAISITTTDGGDVILHGGGMQHSHAQVGHGGRTSANNGSQDGEITIISDGKVELKGSVNRVTGVTNTSASETYAQIGHGGMFNSAVYSGAIEVQAQTGVLLETGGSHYNRAQIGHGGYGAGSNAGNAVEMVDADITVETVAGGVILDARKTVNRSYATAQIGNGGTGTYNAARSGAFRGDIIVNGGTGNVELHGGDRAGSSAQIGNGGTGLAGDHSGNIEVSSSGDLLMDLSAGGNNNHYSRIGHGGIGATTAGAPLTISGNMSGDICVHVGGKVDMNALGGTTENTYIQIGHGGSNVAGDFNGEITVVARGAGGLSLTGGSVAGSYSQIGHGGRNTAGTMNGHLNVVAETGDINLTGGSGTDAYAMLGHGDGSKTSTGMRGGGVHIFAQGDLNGTGGTGAANDGNVYIFHQNNNGMQAGDYISGSGDGYQKVINGSINLPAYSTVDEGTLINGNLGTGLIQILDNSAADYTIDASDFGIGSVNSSDNFFLITGGNITFLTSFQNQGSGDVTLVAGWDGDLSAGIQQPGSVSYPDDGSGGFNYCAPVIKAGGFSVDFNNCDSFGNNGKTLTIGSDTQSGRVSIGSAGGTNTFAAAGIEMFSGNGTTNAGTQLGFYGDGTAATGSINLHVKEGGLALNSGAAQGSFTQVGHGGMLSSPSSSITADINISFCAPGDISLRANETGLQSYAQIGHGGNNWDGIKRGAISIDGARNINLKAGARDASAQIGHGGQSVNDSYAVGEASGTIDVINTTGKVTFSGGNALNAVAQIGHGGVAMRGLIAGDVTVEAETGGIEMSGGSSTRTYTMIGHGGYNNDFLMNGDVMVTAAGTSASDGIIMRGGTGTYSGAFIGSGGYANETTINGDTEVNVTNGGIDMTGGGNQYSNVGIGHSNRGGVATLTGDVDVTVTEGDILLKASESAAGYFSHARIGHGGWDSGDKSGEINVLASDGDILLQASTANSTNSRYNFAQIGHGGYGNGAIQNIDDDISVIATNGAVTVKGGETRASFGQIGHGGLGLSSYLSGSFGGDITVRAGKAVLVEAGTQENTHAMIGNGGSGVKGALSGDVLVEAGTGGVTLNGGDHNFTHALIGNGGYDIDDDVSGSTTVNALGTNALTDGITLKGGEGNQGVAHIGHLHSYSSGSVSGAVEVSALAGDINIEAGDTGYFAHAMIGHGGRDSDGDKTGAVTVTADSGDIFLRAGGNHGGAHYAHAQIGHGGYANGVTGRTYSANVKVEAKDGSVSLTGGDANYDYVQIGHGGTSASTGMSVDFNGTVDVRASNDVSLQGGTGDTAYAQIGHGGRRLSGTAESSLGGVVDGSEITVNAGRDVLVKAGERSYSGAKIGHGHNQQNLTSFVENRITVDAGRHVELVAPQFSSYTGVSYSGTQIGHGGVTATVNGGASGYSGDIILNAGGKLDLLAAKNAITFNYALVGHTAYYNVTGDHSGDITVTTGTEAGLADYGIQLVAGNRDDDAATASSYYSFAAIGHRGHSNGAGGGDLSGNITVKAERGGLTLKGGEKGASTGDVRLHSAQIGHGGYNSDGLKSGFIEVCVDEEILLENGNARQASVQIGHGGYSHNGDITGAVEVVSRSGGITLDSTVGAIDISYTQIGHGGANTSGTLDGDMLITAFQDIDVKGGGFNSTHALIGHGGNVSNGNFSGDIGLLAGGSLSLEGGTHADAFAMVGHGSARPSTTGTRSGAVKLAVGDATVLDDGTAGVRLGHGTSTANAVSDSEFFLTTGTFDNSNSDLGVTDITDVMVEGGDVTFAVLDGDLVVDGEGAFYSNASNVNYLASGNLTMMASVQNAGNGNFGAAAGWSSLTGYDSGTNQFDGSNGLTLTLDFAGCPTLEDMSFDFSILENDSSLWGSNSAVLSVGDGSQAETVVIGSAGGNTSAFGYAVNLSGGDTGSDRAAQIGYNEERQSLATGENSVAAVGTIAVSTKEGGLTLEGGDGGRSEARVGHGGSSSQADMSGDIIVDVSKGVNPGALVMSGGNGSHSGAAIGHGGFNSGGVRDGDISLSVSTATLQAGDGSGASVQIGHGGTNSSGMLSGDVWLSTVGSLTGAAGAAALGYVQIGHGGAGSTGDQSGQIMVHAGTDLSLTAGAAAAGSYAKIGHGDDLDSALNVLAGSGDRSGDIQVGAQNDILLDGAMVGHVNAATRNKATSLSGNTYVAPTREDAVTGAGVLVAANGAEFASSDSGELRFYFPGKVNNQIAAGTLLNGTAYIGNSPNPNDQIRSDEFVNIITGSFPGVPDQHSNLMPYYSTNFASGLPMINGSVGVYSTALGNYSIYYNSVELTESLETPDDPNPPVDPTGPTGPVPPGFFDLLGFFPDDTLTDDDQREHEEQVTGLGEFSFHYEGYSQYGPNGEPTFNFTAWD